MRFCFYSGYRDVKGGYTTLLITLIRELCKQGEKVLLINFSDGIIVKELGASSELLEIADLDLLSNAEIEDLIEPTDLFIVTKFFEFHALLIKNNPRVIYYDINDYISYISMYKYNLKLAFLGKQLVKKLLARNSLVFMDDTGIYNLKQEFALHVADPVFLPVPVQVEAGNRYLEKIRKTDERIRLTYIGRSVDWKMYPLKKILQDCIRVEAGRPISFSIVVDSKMEMEKYIDLDAINGKNGIMVDVLENILPSEINRFLLQNSDLHFAMGTAALDAAKLGIPTIVVDYATKEFSSDYSYTWLYETQNFSLGHNLDKLKARPGKLMQDILKVLNNEKDRVEISEKSYEYVNQNHNVKEVVKKLIRQNRRANFRIKDAKDLVPFLYKAHKYLKFIFKKRQ